MTDYGLSLFKPSTDTCMTWLDPKETGSVVYVSFGSLGSLEKEQMEEVAWGLKRSNCNFLWEVMEGEKSKEMRRNSGKWKELAKEAVDEGGSSDRNI
ncbi:hypothetical protein Patl1_26901 [Pistacia atlantica]|uniref:Uncharacterized protein n=1 Tax=Pistacia atlantica TaxID=434234 RepID=A0ACC1B409_9ROSI|nr:hypothetical protein Patl1_26901 [Pistacia atlantica]